LGSVKGNAKIEQHKLFILIGKGEQSLSAGLFWSLLSTEKLAGLDRKEPALKKFMLICFENMPHHYLNFSGSAMRHYLLS
jgi:hypothetical protein